MERGDVVVFKSPKNPDIEYIKRIIGLPGDIINISNSEVKVNNNLINETYLSAPTNLWEGGCIKDNIPYAVPDDYIFVMGDNRDASYDSRRFGSVSKKKLVGRAWLRGWPPSRVGALALPIYNLE